MAGIARCKVIFKSSMILARFGGHRGETLLWSAFNARNAHGSTALPQMSSSLAKFHSGEAKRAMKGRYTTRVFYVCFHFLSSSIAERSKIDPAPAGTESSTANSYEYVQAPYDIVIKYFCRAESLCLRMNEGSRLHRLDVAERSEWAHRLANAPDALGAIEGGNSNQEVACKLWYIGARAGGGNRFKSGSCMWALGC